MGELKKLKYFIDASLVDNSLVKLETYLSSLKNSKEFLNGDCIMVLMEVLKKSSKHEEKTLHVYCVLTCLRHFLNTVSDTQIWMKLSEYISKLCKIMFDLSSYFIREDTVIQKVLDVTTELVEKVDRIADNLLKFTFHTMLESSLSTKLSKHTRLLIMNVIGTLLQNSSRGTRSEILPSSIDLLDNLSNFLVESDDYETQVSVVDILARSLLFIDLKHKSLFTKNENVEKIFKKYFPFLNFDPDCRLFLNDVNESLGEQQRVFPLPCMMIFADNNRLRKPIDPTYSDFWVDLNLGSRTLSFYYQPANSDTWELMTLPQDRVISAVAKESACQSRSGEKFEAIKLELVMDSSNLSPEWEIPQQVRIYPPRDRFIKTEFVVKKIFGEKYESKVTCSKRVIEETIQNKLSGYTHTSNVHGEAKSFLETSIPKEVPENEEGLKDSNKTKDSPSFPDVDIAEGSPYSRYIKKRLLDQSKCSHGNGAKENQSVLNENITNKDQNFLGKGVMSKGDQIGFVSANGTIKKTTSQSKKENTPISNTNSRKKRLYCLEKSNADDVVMSSQDQVLSVEIPSYKITKKVRFITSQPNINRKNISYSYINHTKEEKSTTMAPLVKQKVFNFEGLEESDKLPSNDEDQESNGERSLNIFKDNKQKTSLERGTRQNIFFKRPEKDSDKGDTFGSPKKRFDFCQNSAYSDLSSLEKTKELKRTNTYSRKKPKPCKRNRVMRIDSSDSDSQLVSPPKLLKKDNNKNEKLSQIKPEFAKSVRRKKIDPLRDNIVINEMKLDKEFDYEEQEMQPREIVVQSLMKEGKGKRKITTRGQGKTTNAAKRKAKQVNPIQTINSEIKKCDHKTVKEDILEKISESITDCLDVVQYDVPESSNALECEDLALDILNLNDDQEKALILNTTFRVSDLLRFGKILMKQIQEKMHHTERLANKEREMNLSTFDYKIQASCNELYGNCQKMESVSDKLEKLNTMYQATYKLHKDITTEINLQAIKIEEAKNDMITNIKKINKSESTSLSTIFRGFGAYLKRVTLAFIQGNTNKSAITN